MVASLALLVAGNKAEARQSAIRKTAAAAPVALILYSRSSYSGKGCGFAFIFCGPDPDADSDPALQNCGVTSNFVK